MVNPMKKNKIRSNIYIRNCFLIQLIYLTGCGLSNPEPTLTATPIPANKATLEATPTVESIPTPFFNIDGNTCINDFEYYAYRLPERGERPLDYIFPLPPWEIAASMPEKFLQPYNGSGVLEKHRYINGYHEIWINHKHGGEYLIYIVEKNEWRTVSSKIEDTGIFVDQLFVSSDNKIWGRNQWIPRDNLLSLDNIPLLSKYNEKNQQFEFASGVLEIPVIFNNTNTHIVTLDSDGLFWLINQNQGIYSYNPLNQINQLHLEIPDYEFESAQFGPDRNLYLQETNWDISLQYTKLMRFDPGRNELFIIPPPNEIWPNGGIYIRDNGEIWVNAVGFRDVGGNWNLLYSNSEEYFENISSLYGEWSLPHLITESSNGYLWFRKGNDLEDNVGVAWLNPETGKGCIFTNISTNIVEDSEHNMWFFTYGKLFKYSFNSMK